MYVQFDIMPVTGFFFPYLLEHAEIASYLARYEYFEFRPFFGVLELSQFNSNFFFAIESSITILVSLTTLFIV